jgi:serine/threonine protein kinase
MEHELGVWARVEGANDDIAGTFLVPIRRIDFRRDAGVQVATMGGGLRDLLQGENYYACGLLMPCYPATLAQQKIPLSEEVLLQFGGQLKIAVSTLHALGLCHLDIKPSNIFITEIDGVASALLGDYGGTVLSGMGIREVSDGYYPSDAGATASPETDWKTLTLTLLEMFGVIRHPVEGIDSAEIHGLVDGINSTAVKAFLLDLLSQQ